MGKGWDIHTSGLVASAALAETCLGGGRRAPGSKLRLVPTWLFSPGLPSLEFLYIFKNLSRNMNFPAIITTLHVFSFPSHRILPHMLHILQFVIVTNRLHCAKCM